MANTGHKKEETREPPWSDLPIELIEMVLRNCNFIDQARIRAVCRRWQSIPRVQPLIQQLPWLMAYDAKDWSGYCKLFDLTYNKNYTVNMSEKITDYYISIHASKSGWLLLSHPTHEIDLVDLDTVAFLLYSPFTNRMIQLPNLQAGDFIRLTATFSADPTCADCVFFILESSFYANTVAVSTCRLGDTTWTTQDFRGCFDAIDNVVYSQGLFWCATARGSLATFSVAQGIWNVVLESPSPLLLPLKDTYLWEANGNRLLVLTYTHVLQWNDIYLVESNGNLLLVLTSHEEDKLRHVFKLDRSKMAWFLEEDIGDEALFLGPTSLSVSKTVAPKLGGSGKIHDFWGSNCAFFSKLAKKDYFLSKIWIEPPS